MSAHLTLLPGDSVEAFRQLVRDVSANIMSAAEMLARLHAVNPGVLDELSTGPDAISEAALGAFLKVAERSLHPALLLNGCPAYQRLKSKPYSLQEKIISAGFVEVVTGEGEGDFIRVDLVKLDGQLLKQAMGLAGIRTLAEQRAWRRRQSQLKSIADSVTDVGLPYELKRDRVRILRGNFELSRRDLLRLLESMED